MDECEHSWKNNSRGSGLGLVTRWCKKCGTYEQYYDDTGATVRLGYLATRNDKGEYEPNSDFFRE